MMTPLSHQTHHQESEPVERLEPGCADCESLLDVYVDDERSGRDVHRLYPPVWRHLRSCARCREARDLLVEALDDHRSEPAPSAARSMVQRLSFLQPPPPDAPWQTHLRPRLAGAGFHLTFSLNLSYLKTSLSAPAPLAARADELRAPTYTHLLLYDTIPVGEQTLAVEVTARHLPNQPDHLALLASVTGSSGLPARLRAVLTWAGQSRAAPVDADGQVDFGKVALTAVQEALDVGQGRFEIAFVEDEGLTVNDLVRAGDA